VGSFSLVLGEESEHIRVGCSS